MCGIYGHLKKRGNENSLHICIEGLKKLEYRGYDSAGIAGIQENQLVSYKTVGKVAALDKSLEFVDIELDMAIAHTRWATHGGITEYNAHPHFDEKGSIALVHNGIIENYQKLKKFLIDKGISFSSDTDTEVISQLISFYYEEDLLEALHKTLGMLEGSFAIAFIHKDHPGVILTASRSSPIVIGTCKTSGDLYLSSDAHALSGKLLDIFYLQDDELAILKNDEIQVFDKSKKLIQKETEVLGLETVPISKEGFDHFLIKEIHEQPEAITRALKNRIDEKNATAYFEELHISDEVLNKVDQVLILACGSSYHAGFVAASIIESHARIPTRVEIASEFRYIDPVLSENTLVIAISQSGETADTLAAVKQVKSKNTHVIALCNVKGSSITRIANSTILLRAGPEISVCSSKAFTSQLTILLLLALKLSRGRLMTHKQGTLFINELKELPSYARRVLEKEQEIASFARKYGRYTHFFFIGRKHMYPTCLESALKLKEISYLHASAYPAGEMKHGPIALVDYNLPTIAFCGNRHTHDKLISNIMEIKSRGGPILAFMPSDFQEAIRIVDDFILIPSSQSDEFSPIPYSIAGQLFAYYVAKIHGTDIDQPRNLAKSVTVE